MNPPPYNFIMPRSARALKPEIELRKEKQSGKTLRRKDEIKRRKAVNFFKISVKVFFFCILLFVCFYEYDYIVNQSGIFDISDIIIGGNTTLGQDEIITYSGVQTGTNIYAVNLANVEKRLKLIPKIKEVSVERINFSKIRILLIERKNYATVKIGDEFFIIDDCGVIIEPGEIETLPFVTGLKIVDNQAEVKSIEPGKLEIAKKWIEIFAGLKIHDIISEINVEQILNTYIYTNNGIKVYIGDETEGFAGMLPYLLRELKNISSLGKNVEYVDVRFNREIAVKYLNN